MGRKLAGGSHLPFFGWEAVGKLPDNEAPVAGRPPGRERRLASLRTRDSG
jgi:hypothetical protein